MIRHSKSSHSLNHPSTPKSTLVLSPDKWSDILFRSFHRTSGLTFHSGPFTLTSGLIFHIRPFILTNVLIPHPSPFTLTSGLIFHSVLSSDKWYDISPWSFYANKWSEISP